MLVTMKPTVVASLGMLHWLVREKIFAELTLVQEAHLEYGLTKWAQKSLLTHEDKFDLQRMTNALVANEKGHYERIKGILKEQQLNFRHLYTKGMPYVDPETCRTFGKS